jgi:hypothetical protein
MAMTPNYRVPGIPGRAFALATGLFSGAVIAGVVAVMIVPEIRARKETPERIAKCHAQEGTARLDANGFNEGCLVPARKSP